VRAPDSTVNLPSVYTEKAEGYRPLQVRVCLGEEIFKLRQLRAGDFCELTGKKAVVEHEVVACDA